MNQTKIFALVAIIDTSMKTALENAACQMIYVTAINHAMINYWGDSASVCIQDRAKSFSCYGTDKTLDKAICNSALAALKAMEGK